MMKVSVALLMAALAFVEQRGVHAHGREVDDTFNDKSAHVVVGPASIANIVCDGVVTCKSVYVPVCTTTGLTFANPCEFKNAYCEKPRDTFYIASVGPCDVFQTHSIEDGDEEQSAVTKEVLDVPIDIDVVTNPTIHDSGGLESPLLEDVVTDEGSASASSSDTDNDSNNSDSEGTSHIGDDGIETPTAEPTLEATSTRPPIDCSNGDLTCDIPDDPVCASNGFTYINECQFKNAYCESPSDELYIVNKGPCDSALVPMQVQSISIEEQEIWGTVFDVPVDLDGLESVAQPSELDCDGQIKCSNVEDPVCDSNGNTFHNECEFKNAFCENPSSGLHIVSKGRCPLTFRSQSTATDGVTAEVLNVPVELDVDAVDTDANASVFHSRRKVSAYCTLVCPTGNVLVAPLCGTDSRSYINDCHLLSSKCEQPDLEKQYDGLCVMGQAPVTTASARRAAATGDTATISTQEASRPKCNAFCGRHYAPICGSNGVTYANPCLFEFASCQNPKITKLSDGKCAEINSASLDSSQQQQHNQAACVPTICPSSEAFVCGSDGTTYLNVCMLNNARCHIPGLTVAHEGECGAQTVLTCGTRTCPRYSECRHDPATQVAYCADVCHPDRCGPHEECKLVHGDCYTAPCSPVATCVRKAHDSGHDD